MRIFTCHDLYEFVVVELVLDWYIICVDIYHIAEKGEILRIDTLIYPFPDDIFIFILMPVVSVRSSIFEDHCSVNISSLRKQKHCTSCCLISIFHPQVVFKPLLSYTGIQAQDTTPLSYKMYFGEHLSFSGNLECLRADIVDSDTSKERKNKRSRR